MLNEKEICHYLDIPSIPKKEWDGKSSFKDGVALVKLAYGGSMYAVATFDTEHDTQPKIKKVFSLEQFTEIEKIFVVPSYMDIDVDNMDLDEESKDAARNIVNEALELESTGITSPSKDAENENEYYYDFIHNDEEAQAYIRAYNKSHGIRGNRVPKSHEGLIMRLSVIWKDENNK